MGQTAVHTPSQILLFLLGADNAVASLHEAPLGNLPLAQPQEAAASPESEIQLEDHASTSNAESKSQTILESAARGVTKLIEKVCTVHTIFVDALL